MLEMQAGPEELPDVPRQTLCHRPRGSWAFPSAALSRWLAGGAGSGGAGRERREDPVASEAGRLRPSSAGCALRARLEPAGAPYPSGLRSPPVFAPRVLGWGQGRGGRRWLHG